MLREDQALATLLGHPLPAATTVRDFLEAFHVEDGPLWAAGPQATIPRESAPLAGLDTANRTLVAGLQRGARRRRPPWMWMPRSWRVTRTRPPWPTTAPGAISRWWCSGRSRMSSCTTSSAMAMSRRAAGMCGYWNRPWPICPGDHADRPARRQRALRDRRAPLVRGAPDPVRHQRRHVRAAQGRDPAPPRGGLAGRAEEPDAIRSWAEVPRPDDGDHRKASALPPAVPRDPDPEAPRESLRRREQVRYFAVVTNRTDDGLTTSCSGTGRRRGRWSISSHPQERVGGGGPAQREVRGERRLVPAQRADVQPAHRAQAVDLTRRCSDRAPKRLRFLLFNTVGKVVRTPGGRSCGSRAFSNMPYWFWCGARSPDWPRLSRRLGGGLKMVRENVLPQLFWHSVPSHREEDR